MGILEKKDMDYSHIQQGETSEYTDENLPIYGARDCSTTWLSPRPTLDHVTEPPHPLQRLADTMIQSTYSWIICIGKLPLSRMLLRTGSPRPRILARMGSPAASR